MRGLYNIEKKKSCFVKRPRGPTVFSVCASFHVLEFVHARLVCVPIYVYVRMCERKCVRACVFVCVCVCVCVHTFHFTCAMA